MRPFRPSRLSKQASEHQFKDSGRIFCDGPKDVPFRMFVGASLLQ